MAPDSSLDDRDRRGASELLVLSPQPRSAGAPIPDPKPHAPFETVLWTWRELGSKASHRAPLRSRASIEPARPKATTVLERGYTASVLPQIIMARQCPAARNRCTAVPAQLREMKAGGEELQSVLSAELGKGKGGPRLCLRRHTSTRDVLVPPRADTARGTARGRGRKPERGTRLSCSRKRASFDPPERRKGDTATRCVPVLG
jgi:hypothetical protein